MRGFTKFRPTSARSLVHPEVKGFYLANGFSGHGVMQAPATGKLISELIRLGRYQTLDAGEFSVERFERGGAAIPEKMN